MNLEAKVPRWAVVTFNVAMGLFALYCAILCNFAALDRVNTGDIPSAVLAWLGCLAEATMALLLFTGRWFNWFMRKIS